MHVKPKIRGPYAKEAVRGGEKGLEKPCYQNELIYSCQTKQQFNRL